ncbi:MAG: DUF4411 family protein [Lachnospiraceae bacterium]|nr:DUF4411 family protein [Lachnospiraceae bacterium]
MGKQETFLVDSNTFITPFRLYYSFDLVPSYWKELKKYLDSGSIVVLDLVKKEIEGGKDELSEWLSGVDDLIVVPKVTEQTVKSYQEVMRFVSSSGYYKESALSSWAPSNVADPWLIASAKTNGYTLVTEEKKSGGLSKKNPNKYAKIPDVAEQLGVKTIRIYDMMRRLGIII